MKRYAPFLITIAILLFAGGCRNAQQVSAASNKETKRQTTAVSNQVNAAQKAIEEADADYVAIYNDPATPEPVREKAKAAHDKNVAAIAALKPINESILPKIDDAADKQLQATVDATNEGAKKERLITDGLVATAVAGGLIYSGVGVAISLVAGALAFGIAGVVLGTVSAVAHDWGVPLLIIVVAGAVAIYFEKHWKGSWKATLHDAFNESKVAAKNLPADVNELWGKVEAIESKLQTPAITSTSAVPQ